MPSVYPVLNNFKTGNNAGPHSFPCSTPPLQEGAGAEGIVGVHVPFSLTDLAQIEERVLAPSPQILIII